MLVATSPTASSEPGDGSVPSQVLPAVRPRGTMRLKLACWILVQAVVLNAADRWVPHAEAGQSMLSCP